MALNLGRVEGKMEGKALPLEQLRRMRMVLILIDQI